MLSIVTLWALYKNLNCTLVRTAHPTRNIKKVGRDNAAPFPASIIPTHPEPAEGQRSLCRPTFVIASAARQSCRLIPGPWRLLRHFVPRNDGYLITPRNDTYLKSNFRSRNESQLRFNRHYAHKADTHAPPDTGVWIMLEGNLFTVIIAMPENVFIIIFIGNQFQPE